MAKLEHVRLKDFRAFRKASFELSDSGLMLVTGPNNVGKSALLSALDVLGSQSELPAARNAKGDDPRLWFRFRLNNQERRALIGSAMKGDDLLGGELARWIEWEYVHDGTRFSPVAARVSWPERGNPAIIDVHPSDTLGQVDVRSMSTSLATWNGESLSVMSSGSPPGPQVIEQLYRVTGAGSNGPLRAIQEWRTGYFHFEPLRQTAGRTSRLGGIVPTLASNGSNLAPVLLHIMTNTPEVWNKICSLMRQIVPGVGSLVLPANVDQFEVAFTDDYVSGYRHNLKDLGTGVEQILMTLVVGLTQTARTVVLEEPETGLHPAAQRALLGLLQDWSKDRLIIASTHSAAMLDWTSSRTSVLAVSRREAESTVEPVTTDAAAVLRDLGVRLSDVLSAERILILEGPSDKDILDVWFPHIVRSPNIAMPAGGGGYNARYAEVFSKWLDSADKLGARRVLYVRDRDELPPEIAKKLERSEYVHVLPCRELENLLLSPAAVTSVINVERETLGKTQVSEENVSAAIREFADDLKDVVVLKRVMASLNSPIRLVDHRMRQSLSKQKPDAMKHALVAEVCSRVPNAANIERNIEEDWELHAENVNKAWETEWRQIAPGADILNSVFIRFLDRGYRKSVDGIALATAMDAPPLSLKEVLDKFMAE